MGLWSVQNPEFIFAIFQEVFHNGATVISFCKTHKSEESERERDEMYLCKDNKCFVGVAGRKNTGPSRRENRKVKRNKCLKQVVKNRTLTLRTVLYMIQQPRAVIYCKILFYFRDFSCCDLIKDCNHFNSQLKYIHMYLRCKGYVADG